MSDIHTSMKSAPRSAATLTATARKADETARPDGTGRADGAEAKPLSVQSGIRAGRPHYNKIKWDDAVEET